MESNLHAAPAHLKFDIDDPKRLYNSTHSYPMPSLAHRHRQLDFNRNFYAQESSEDELASHPSRDPLRKADQIFEEDRFSSFLGKTAPTTHNSFRANLPLFERFLSGSQPDPLGTQPVSGGATSTETGSEKGPEEEVLTLVQAPKLNINTLFAFRVSSNVSDLS
jgi:hypothetical protein